MGEKEGTYAEAEHDHVGVIIRERAEPVEFFLTCRIPKAELDVCVVDKNVCAC